MATDDRAGMKHGESTQGRMEDELQAALAMSMLCTPQVAQVNGKQVENTLKPVEKPSKNHSKGSKKQKKGGTRKGKVPDVVVNIGANNSSVTTDDYNPNVILIDPAKLQAQVIAAGKQRRTSAKSPFLIEPESAQLPDHEPEDDAPHKKGRSTKIEKQSYNAKEKEDVDMGFDGGTGLTLVRAGITEQKSRSRKSSKSKTVAEMLRSQGKSGRRKKSSESAPVETDIVPKPKSPRSPRRKSPERMYASKADNYLPPKKRKLAYYRMNDQKSPGGETSDANVNRPSVVQHTSSAMLSPDKKIPGGLDLLSKVVAQNFSADATASPTINTQPIAENSKTMTRQIPTTLRQQNPFLGTFFRAPTGKLYQPKTPAELRLLQKIQLFHMLRSIQQSKKVYEKDAVEKTATESLSGFNAADPTNSFIMLKECQMALTADEDGDLPIHIAVVQGNKKLVAKLIHLMKMQNKTLDIFNKLRQTPLHLAVITQNLEIMRQFLDNGANPNIQDRNGQTCIHLAVQRDNMAVLHTIARESQNEVKMNLRNYEGFSPVHISVQNQSKIIIRILKKLGANVDCTDGKSGRTPLFHAVESNLYEIADELLNNGADPNIVNYAGYTAAFSANSRGFRQICVLLGLYGAEVPFKMEPMDQKPPKQSKAALVTQETISRLGKYITSKDKISGGIYLQNVEEDGSETDLNDTRLGSEKFDRKRIKSPQSDNDVNMAVSVLQNTMSGGIVSLNKTEIKSEPNDSCPPSPISIRTLYSHNGGNVTVSSASQLAPLKMPIFSTVSPLLNSPMTTPISPYLSGTPITSMFGQFPFPSTIPTAVAATTPQTLLPPVLKGQPDLIPERTSPKKSSSTENVTSKNKIVPSVVDDQEGKPLDLTQRGLENSPSIDSERTESPHGSVPSPKKSADGKDSERVDQVNKSEGGPPGPRFISVGPRFPFAWPGGNQMGKPPCGVYIDPNTKQPVFMMQPPSSMPGSPMYFPQQPQMVMMPSGFVPASGSHPSAIIPRPAVTTLTSASDQQMPTGHRTEQKDSKSEDSRISPNKESPADKIDTVKSDGKLSVQPPQQLRLDIPPYRHIRPQIPVSPLARTESQRNANSPSVTSSVNTSGTDHTVAPAKADAPIKVEPKSPTDSTATSTETKTVPSQLLQQLNSPTQVFMPHGPQMMGRHTGLPMTVPRPELVQGSPNPGFQFQWTQQWRNRMPMMGPRPFMMQPMPGQGQFIPGYPQGHLPPGQGHLLQGHMSQGQGQLSNNEIKSEPGTTTTGKKPRKRKKKSDQVTSANDGDKVATEVGDGTGAGDQVQPKKKRKRKKKHSETADYSKVGETVATSASEVPACIAPMPIYYYPTPTSMHGPNIPSVVGVHSDYTYQPRQVLIAPKPPQMIPVPAGLRPSHVDLNIPKVSVPSSEVPVGKPSEGVVESMNKSSEAQHADNYVGSASPTMVACSTATAEQKTGNIPNEADDKNVSASDSVFKKALTYTVKEKERAIAGDDSEDLPSIVVVAEGEEEGQEEDIGPPGAMSIFDAEERQWKKIPPGPKSSASFIEHYKSLRRTSSPSSIKETSEGHGDDGSKSIDIEENKMSNDDAKDVIMTKFSALNSKFEQISEEKMSDLNNSSQGQGGQSISGKGTKTSGEGRTVTTSAKITETSGDKDIVTSSVAMAPSELNKTVVSGVNNKADVKKPKPRRTSMCKTSLEKLQMVIDSVGSGLSQDDESPIEIDSYSEGVDEAMEPTSDHVGGELDQDDESSIEIDPRSGKVQEAISSALGDRLSGVLRENQSCIERDLSSEKVAEDFRPDLETADRVGMDAEKQKPTDKSEVTIKDVLVKSETGPDNMRQSIVGECSENEVKQLVGKVPVAAETSLGKEEFTRHGSNDCGSDKEVKRPVNRGKESELCAVKAAGSGGQQGDELSPSGALLGKEISNEDEELSIGSETEKKTESSDPRETVDLGSVEENQDAEPMEEDVASSGGSERMRLIVKKEDMSETERGEISCRVDVKYGAGILRVDSGESVEIENGSGAKLLTSEINDSSPSRLPQILDEVLGTPCKTTLERSMSMGEPPILVPETEMAQKNKAEDISCENSNISESVSRPESDFHSPPKLEPETDIFVRTTPTSSVSLFDDGSPGSDDCVMLGSRPLTPKLSLTPNLTPEERPPSLEIESVHEEVGVKMEHFNDSDSDTDSSNVLAASSPRPIAHFLTLDLDVLSPKANTVSGKFENLKEATKPPSSNVAHKSDISAEKNLKTSEDKLGFEINVLSVEESYTCKELQDVQLGSNQDIGSNQISEKSHQNILGSKSEHKKEERAPRNIFDSIVSSCGLTRTTDYLGVTCGNPEAISISGNSRTSNEFGSTAACQTVSSTFPTFPYVKGTTYDNVLDLPSTSNNANSQEKFELEISDDDDNSSFELEMDEVVSVRSKHPAVLPRSCSLLEKIVDSVGIDKRQSDSDFSQNSTNLSNVMSDSVTDPVLASSSFGAEDRKHILHTKKDLDPQFEISDDSSVELPDIKNDGADDLKLGTVPMSEVLKMKRNIKKPDKSEQLSTKEPRIVPGSLSPFGILTTGGTSFMMPQLRDSLKDGVDSLPMTFTELNKEPANVPSVISAVPSVLDDLMESETAQKVPKPLQYGSLIPTVVDD